MAKHASRVVLTPEGRMSYPNLITSKEFKDRGVASGKFSYSTDLLFTEEAMSHFKVLDTATGQLAEKQFKEILAELAREEWPGIKLGEVFVGIGMKGWPIKKGDTFADAQKAKQKDAEHYRGLRYIPIKSNVSDKVQPPILSSAAHKVTVDGKPRARTFNRGVPGDMEIARSLFVGGNYAMAELNVVANEVSQIKYLTCYVNSVRYIKEGTKFGNQGGGMMDRFGGVTGGESDYDPTAGMDQVDDEIPF